MAPRTQIVKIGALILSQFGLLAAVNFQLFGVVTAYKMMELKRNLSLAAYLSARKTYLQRKRRYLQARRVHSFPDSLVLRVDKISRQPAHFTGYFEYCAGYSEC